MKAFLKFCGIAVAPQVFNNLTAWNPQLWAREGIEILKEKLIWANLVHRDFEPLVAKYGDTVNTRIPSEFLAEPYARGDTITLQDANATNVQVKLDQIADVSFTIYDTERTFSFADLITEYIDPLITALARVVDRKVAGQAPAFLNNTVGGMGMASSSTIRQYLVDADEKLNNLKVDENGRQFVFGSALKAKMLMENLFVKVNEAGDNTALRRAWMGDLFGLNNYMSLSTPNCIGATLATGTTTSANIAAGATALALTAGRAIGQYFTIAGDMTPLRADGTGTTPGLIGRTPREATTSGAVVTTYAQGDVNHPTAGTYAIGWYKRIGVDGTGVPKVGQLVSFGAGTAEYVIVSIKGSDIELDRPLEAAVADNAKINYGPVGSMNLAFKREAIALVNRPLDVPRVGNAVVAVANAEDLSLRISMDWQQSTKSLVVSGDVLFGLKVLNGNNGCVVLG